MKQALSILIGVMLIVAVGLAGASCVPMPTPAPTPAPSPTTKTGTLEVRVTDAPPRDEVTSIMVTASKVEVHKAVAEQERQEIQGGDNQTRERQQIQQGEGEWLSLNITDNASSFDLLKIKGIEELFATSEVNAGKYTQVRLTIDKIEVALGDGKLQPATVPSGQLKFVHPFDVVAGQKTVILLDFDAAKSVNVTGQGKIMVKPVVKLMVKGPASASPSTGTRVVSQEESQTIAEDFVKNSPTFVFDGMDDTLKLADNVTLRTPYSWQFTFEFDSRHAGYGDRTGQMLAQVITPHKAVITVIQGEVTRAVMDEKWDMLKQQAIGSSPTEKTEGVSVDATYNGKEVEINAGSILTVTLESNPTTGFKWELAGITDQTVLELVENKYAPGDKAKGKPPLAGAGGEEVWTFKALKAGTARLSLEYSRPWPGGEKGVNTFNLTVIVK